MFPDEGKENSLGYIIPAFGISAIVVLMAILVKLYIIVGLKNHYGIDVINFAMVCLVSISGLIWLNYFCIKNRHILISLAEAISDFQSNGKPPGYDEFNRKMDILSRIHLMYVFGGSMLYFVVFAPMHKSNCEKINLAKNLTELCSLLVPMYVPFEEYTEPQNTFNITVIAFIQFLILMYAYTTCGTILWLNMEMVEYIRFRIRHLKRMMIRAFKNTDKAERRTIFRQAVQYHEDILRMSRLADTFFGRELLLHVVLTGAILGASAFVMIDTQSLDVLMVFIGWLNGIIMGCVSGQRLINESSTIPDILYQVDWYNFETDLKKDIVFFLLRSRKPMHIQAGNVIMTNQLIIEILRTAYSYITLLSSIDK